MTHSDPSQTYHCEGLQIEQEHRELDDLVDVVWRVDRFTGGLKVQDEEELETVGVGLQRALQLPGRARLLQDGPPSKVGGEAFADDDVRPPTRQDW